MERYEDKLDQALQYLKEPSRLSPTGYSPIVYLVYQPEDVMTVRNLADTFLPSKAEFYGLKTHFISIGDIIEQYINHHGYLDIWASPGVNEENLYNSIRQEIVSEECLEKAILEIQDEYLAEGNALLVIRDLEMLHPFRMMGVIENNIYNHIKMPILVLYPGETLGTARSFLGIYNQDGNYRSINLEPKRFRT